MQRAVDSTEQNLRPEPTVRRLRSYRCTKADIRIRRAVKEERGSTCEACEGKFPLERLSVHHILETRIYPEFARQSLNMLVLCSKCHSSITNAEYFAASIAMHFYSTLSMAVRQRHLSFLESLDVVPPALLAAFRSGDSWYWNERAVDDLMR